MIVLHKIFNKLAVVMIAIALLFPIILAPALAAPSDPFVLEDSTGNKTPYSRLYDVVDHVNFNPGKYTLYLTKDYDMSQDFSLNALKGNLGNIDLTVCSLDGKHTLISNDNYHFQIYDNVKLTFKDIILDGNYKQGGIIADSNRFVTLRSHVILEDGFVLKNCNGYVSIAIQNADLTINEGVNIIDNKSIALSAEQLSMVTINGGTFKNNKQALNFRGETLDINGGLFENNSSGDSVSGGAISIGPGTLDMEQNISIKNATFIGNKAGEGGAISTILKNTKNNKVDMINCTFKNNQSSYRAGALFIQTPEKPNIIFNIENCRFFDNYNVSDSYYGGGAIYYERLGHIYSYISDTPELSAYNNLIIDASTEFKGNKSTPSPYSLPPLNYKDFTNLKFKSTSFTDKGYPKVLNMDKTLLNNYDINYTFPKFACAFVANGGRFNDGTDERLSDLLEPWEEEYTIFSDIPQRDSFEFVGWEDEDGNLHQPGEKLPPATRNRIFKAKWKEPVAPQTGDTFNLVLYVALAAVAMIVFGFILNKNKRKK